MHRYAALLRGIAPALPNMKNDQLRGVFEGLGYAQVSSVLASGNILFHSAETDVPALERTIQQALVDDLGIGGGTIIRERGELRALLDSDPFPGLTHGKGTYLIATFLKAGNEPPHELPVAPDPRTRIVRYDQAARAFLAVVDNSDPGRTPDFMTGWTGPTARTSPPAPGSRCSAS